MLRENSHQRASANEEMPLAVDRHIRRVTPKELAIRISDRVIAEDEEMTKSGVVTAISASSIRFRDADGNVWAAPREIVRVLRAAA